MIPASWLKEGERVFDSFASFDNLLAGDAPCILDGNIPRGGSLVGVLCSSSVSIKVVLKIDGRVRYVELKHPVEAFILESPSRDTYRTLSGLELLVANIDTQGGANVYATFWWVSELEGGLC